MIGPYNKSVKDWCKSPKADVLTPFWGFTIPEEMAKKD
jgi:hypothetical protein